MARPDNSPPRANPRRWLLRGLSLLLLSGCLLAADRLCNWLWYRPVYDDVALPDPSPAGRIRSKSFLRSVPDPFLDSRTRADIRLRMRTYSMLTGKWLPYDIVTNSLGFRGPEPAQPKPPGTVRVVAMGGSSTFAQGVPTREAYMFRLAAALDRRFPGTRVEAVNAGVQGYGTLHSLTLYQQRVRALKPDLLVVAYDVNDGMQPYPAEEVARWPAMTRDQLTPRTTDSLPVSPGVFLLQRSQEDQDKVSLTHRLLPALLRSGLFLTFQYGWSWAVYLAREGWPAPPPALPSRLDEAAEPGSACTTPPRLGAVARPGDSHVVDYRENLAGLIYLARQDGVPIIFLSIPLEGFGDLRPAYPYSAIMAHLARARDRRHVDPTPAFCAHPLSRLMIDFSHPTPFGHDLLARALEPAAVQLLGDKLIK